ncbi:glycosyltransferase [Bradyrhizobium yuanmingense]|uniref:glycosyltransferase family 2 protein n=1 Tax=Bradyrhizobium TaxID=374 RepID=UPI0012FCEA7C|nr:MULTISPECIES: glycosyltransferase family 2 protein [Bradyrhizobium]MDF0583204.1 glycosyltransferase family 2 protein [Bradyrhizobium yuanmingense]MVT55881.1 glycosyltransferase [Bradyrhizobium yuanmingense]
MPDAIYRAAEPDISIIIVSYNTRTMTLECIRSILAQTTTVLYEVIVFDNASTDGSPEAIRANFPQLELIASQENLGFAGANNIAAMRARGRRFLLLNPDTLILDHAIDHLHEFADANPRFGIWGGRTVLSDGRLNPGSCWGDATLWSIFCFTTGLTSLKRSSAVFNPEGYGGWKRDSIRAVDIVTGCFLLIDRELWKQLDGFDPEFFMYGEEADLCRRARKLGASPTITPAATIIHYGQSSEPDQAEQRIKVLAGRITLLRRHNSAATILAGKSLYMMLPLLRLLAYGTAGLVSGRSDLREKARNWRYVWQHRQRWVNGWSNVGVRSARGNPRNNLSEEIAAVERPSGDALSRSRQG